MKVVINGYLGIEKELESSYEKEFEEFKESIDAQKEQVEGAHQARMNERVEKIKREAEERAERERHRRVARAKAEFDESVLQVKAAQLAELAGLVQDALQKLSSEKKQAFVQKCLDEALGEIDEPVAFVEVPKGVSVKTKGEMKQTLSELGVVVHTKSGALVRKSASISEQELAKLLKREGVWSA